MRTDNGDIGLSHESGYSILFFGLTLVYATIAHRLFSNGEIKFRFAIAALMLLAAGTGGFCLRSLLMRRRAERKMTQGKEEPHNDR